MMFHVKRIGPHRRRRTSAAAFGGLSPVPPGQWGLNNSLVYREDMRTSSRVAARYNATQIEAKATQVHNSLVKNRARLWRELLQFYQHQSYGTDPNPQKAERTRQRLLKTYTSLRNDAASVIKDARSLADKLKADKAISHEDEKQFDNYLTFRSHVEGIEYQLRKLDGHLHKADDLRSVSHSLIGTKDDPDMAMINWMQLLARDLHQLGLG